MKKDKFGIPAFLVFSALFQELLFHCWIGSSLAEKEIVSLVLFALGLGCVLAFLVGLIPWPKGRKWAAVVLGALLAVPYMVEYFMLDAYSGFMTMTSILNSAGDVAGDFLEISMSVVVRNLWRIAIVLLPAVIFALFGRGEKLTWKTQGVLAAAAAAAYLLGIGAVYTVSHNADRLKENYNFDNAVRSFGLHVGLVLDARQGGAAASEELVLDFEPVTIPTQPPQPTATEETPVETEPEETEPVVYGDNVLDLDFAVLAETEKNPGIAAIHKYVAAQTPSKQNEYTGLFAGKNLIFITAESFSKECIDPVYTPTLYRLATQGIQFNDYYQPLWGGSTSTGEFSNLIGLVAANGSLSIQEGTEQDLFLTIGNQLRREGYYSVAYHDHAYTYYNRHLSHPKLGYDQFIGFGNGMEQGVTEQWPQSDEEMFRFTVDQYIDNQPFNIYYMTVSGHGGYGYGQLMANKNYSLVEDMDRPEMVKRYFAACMEVELGVRYLVQRLEEEGITDDTVIVLGTDHYPYALQASSTWQTDRDYVSELYGYPVTNNMERDHSGLIIWSGCLEGKDIVVDTPVYSLDILPTLSNLFGVPYDSRLLVGRDVFSEAEPLVLWPDFSWKTTQGFYDFSVNRFYPNEGVEVDQAYIDAVSTIVRNRINYSRSVQREDYFNKLTPLLFLEN